MWYASRARVEVAVHMLAVVPRGRRAPELRLWRIGAAAADLSGAKEHDERRVVGRDHRILLHRRPRGAALPNALRDHTIDGLKVPLQHQDLLLLVQLADRVLDGECVLRIDFRLGANHHEHVAQ